MGKRIEKHHSGKVFIITVLVVVVTSVFSYNLGFSYGQSAQSTNALSCLRLGGYNFISPLLTCDTTQDIITSDGIELRNRLTSYIQSATSTRLVGSASVYIRGFKDGGIVEVNPTALYYPASLVKIPLMIATYKMAEDVDTNFLTESFLWDDTTNYNAGIEIQPQYSLQSGQSYTIKDALTMMVAYSDNNALEFLTKHINLDIYATAYKDLQLPLKVNEAGKTDYMTAKNFSYFLRVLRNATYLGKTYSEQALELLSKVDFEEGLIAGVPQGIIVSHKFGIGNGELHDCGIVYAHYPYLICVMTKGSTKLTSSEQVIKTISSMVYTALH